MGRGKARKFGEGYYKGVWSRRNKDYGFVYVFDLGFDTLYKIGCSKSWEKRLRHLRAGNPNMGLVALWRVGHMKRDEEKIHLVMSHRWVEREIFRLRGDDILLLKQFFQDHPVDDFRDDNWKVLRRLAGIE